MHGSRSFFCGSVLRSVVWWHSLIATYCLRAPRCYTEKAREARQRPERQDNTRANREKLCRPTETKPYSNATHPHKRQNNPMNGLHGATLLCTCGPGQCLGTALAIHPFPSMVTCAHSHIYIGPVVGERDKSGPFFRRSWVRFRVPPWVSNTIARDHLAEHRRRPCELRATV